MGANNLIEGAFQGDLQPVGPRDGAALMLGDRQAAARPVPAGWVVEHAAAFALDERVSTGKRDITNRAESLN